MQLKGLARLVIRLSTTNSAEEELTKTNPETTKVIHSLDQSLQKAMSNNPPSPLHISKRTKLEKDYIGWHLRKRTNR
jgi:hypothetical protein